MNAFQFWSSIIGSLAWPVAAITIAFLFKTQIAALLARIKEASLGPGKLTFAQEAELVELEMDVVGVPRIVSAVGIAAGSSTVEAHGVALEATQESLSLLPTVTQEAVKAVNLITVSPKAAVLESWGMIERAIEELAVKHGIAWGEGRSEPTFETAKRLKLRDVLTTQMMVLLAHLRKVRNSAAHGQEVDAEGALRFVNLVLRFLNLMN